MELIQRIEQLIAPVAAEMGLDVLRVRFGGEGKNRILQIMAERLDGSGLTLNECGRLSRETSALLDVEDWIDGAYSLEVSSPGLERPLTRLQDYQRFAGRAAQLEMDELIEGRKRFKGILNGINDDEEILLKQGETDVIVKLPYRAIYRAKLVITDEMIKDAQRQSKQKRNQNTTEH